ncbi:MAG TPA: YqgE/AlgH family protein, partial [Opitutaceae bacterium]|nr:YqgE/AlgH family protein [Opitutaceae bacterium]
AFLGYAGWTGGQLEGELRQNTWVVRPVGGEELLTNMSGRSMWRELLTDISPELRVLADEPENPEVN